VETGPAAGGAAGVHVGRRWGRRRVEVRVRLDGTRWVLRVVNRSAGWDVVVTHAWFDGDPRVDFLADRPGVVCERLPVRLAPGSAWEARMATVLVSHVRDVGRAGRVRLSTGKTAKSRPGGPARQG
jgi:hypothetical protein